jgi:hypothetical protein
MNLLGLSLPMEQKSQVTRSVIVMIASSAINSHLRRGLTGRSMTSSTGEQGFEDQGPEFGANMAEI